MQDSADNSGQALRTHAAMQSECMHDTDSRFRTCTCDRAFVSNVAACICAMLWGPGGEFNPFPPSQSTQMMWLLSSEPQQDQQGSRSAYQPCNQCIQGCQFCCTAPSTFMQGVTQNSMCVALGEDKCCTNPYKAEAEATVPNLASPWDLGNPEEGANEQTHKQAACKTLSVKSAVSGQTPE